MSPVSTRLAITIRAMVAATMPALPRRRLLTPDHDQHGAGLHLRAGGRADLRDATRERREQLVLHLHRLERGEWRVGHNVVALLHVHRLQETGHRRPQLDSAGSRSRGAAICAERPFIDDGRANIVTVDVEAERIVRYHGDLVAFSGERRRGCRACGKLRRDAGVPVLDEPRVVPAGYEILMEQRRAMECERRWNTGYAHLLEGPPHARDRLDPVAAVRDHFREKRVVLGRNGHPGIQSRIHPHAGTRRLAHERDDSTRWEKAGPRILRGDAALDRGA